MRGSWGESSPLDVEEIAQPTLLLLGVSVRCVLAVMTARAIVVVRAVVVALDELVELATVGPHTSALGAVVDLDALSFEQLKGGAINRALHRGEPPLSGASREATRGRM